MKKLIDKIKSILGAFKLVSVIAKIKKLLAGKKVYLCMVLIMINAVLNYTGVLDKEVSDFLLKVFGASGLMFFRSTTKKLLDEFVKPE